MYTSSELSANMTRDKRKSMRTSAIIHIIIILLCLLPFLKSPFPPKNYNQPILVEFEQGSSNEGAKRSSASADEASSDSAPSEEAVEREVKPETKPIERTTPPAVLTSEIEPPLIKTSKVKKVEVKTTKPTESIPQQAEVKTVPVPPKEEVFKPTKVKKIEITIEQPSTSGSGSGNNPNSTNSGSGSGDSDATGDGGGEGGTGSSSDGDGNQDGRGDGNKGDGNSDRGEGSDGRGEGNSIGDGILTRQIIKHPQLNDIIKESGKMSFNVCVDRAGKVTDVEYNKKHSTISDFDVIRKTLSRASEYQFEVDKSAPPKECGRLTFIINIKN